ncbi:hypothetical protein SAMN02745136_05715 [Anaerocolumna jejuensis DSM 15929]|uniref:Uncharacterized protein n=1 Tax=Anaerocolumna jejuensis DSM 15929 TaxID=1121322 RepID=A0A1M7DJX1_9FIRM|nr:hypothetical protein [Anaerocolumna jejuensis]SHL79687.1 hypothetical protein SAMN02745136_05715 [Anaerocolumna jejuensis DSM 15929]
MKLLIGFVIAFKKSKKIMMPLLIVYIIFFSCFGFPIGKKDFVYMLYILFSLLIICLMFSALFENKIILMLCTYFVCNLIGMCLHFIIEYGEVTIQRDFTLINILVSLMQIPIVIAGSLLINRLILIKGSK